MNPGDVYRPPGGPGDQRQRDQQGYLSPTQPNFPPVPSSATYPVLAQSPYQAPSSPYNSPGPLGQQQLPHSQSQPFVQYNNTGPQGMQQAQNTGGQRYSDPFNELPQPPPGGGYAEPSRQYPSQPNMAPTPVPFPPNNNLPQYNTQSPQAQPPLSPPRARFDSSVSYFSHGGTGTPPPGGPSYPYGLSDNRLASPPPLLPHMSSSSSSTYPPHPTTTPQGGLYSNHQDDDMNDSAPLLSHAHPDPRFGIPQSTSALSMGARYQLSDNGRTGPRAQEGDMGVVPGAWDNGGHTNGYGNGGLGADDDDVNVHYGPVPTRVVRRNRTQKRVA